MIATHKTETDAKGEEKTSTLIAQHRLDQHSKHSIVRLLTGLSVLSSALNHVVRIGRAVLRNSTVYNLGRTAEEQQY